MSQPKTTWDEAPLEKFGEIFSGGTPSRATPSFWNGSVPWVTPGEITKLKGKYIFETRERITQDGVVGSAATVLPAGSILVTTRATLGLTAIAAVPITTNQGFKSIVPNGSTDSIFSYYLIQALKPEMVRLASGTTFLEISKADFARIKTKRPNRDEQNRIGAALDTMDEAIAKTEAVMAKLRQVRAGLIYDLLASGLDKNGQLRNCITQPKEFQDSPVGRIPREWDCKTLEDAADWFSGGTPSRSQISWWTGNVPILTPKDMKVFEISDTIEHVTEEAALAGSKMMPAETAFIVVRGMILAHTFPVCLSTRPFAFNQDIKAVRGRESLKTRFLAHWFAANSSLFLRKATEATHGTKKLDMPELHHVHIAIPKPDEQDEIVRRIEGMDADINLETRELGKLELLKSGLMNDLLNGRVHVPANKGGCA
jgi:type I restriction enzyme S subunit